MSETMRLIKRGMRTAVLVEERLSEYYEEPDSAESLVGALFLGRVERVLPAVKAAFVRLGLKQNGFLPLQESESFHKHCGPAPLMSDQELIVQVKKDAKGDKGAFLTRDIALPGEFVLLMPQNTFIGVSKRVMRENERARARELGAHIADGRFGVIVRHAALFAPQSEVLEEAEEIWSRWQVLAAQAKHLRAPALLHREPDMLSVLLRDYAARYDCEINADTPCSDALPKSAVWRQQSEGELEALWRAKRVDDQLALALNRRVELAGGGSLVIDEREALQTIDVNSGSAVHSQKGESLALVQNLAAVPEIARQLRLRNLSGIVLVDFIDMETEEQRSTVRAAMEEAVSGDRVKTVVHAFTSLGLLEIARRRTRESLLDALTEPCAACHGMARVRKQA
ncbi:MAG: ribonuclease E/G [Clostridia bacterium]